MALFQTSGANAGSYGYELRVRALVGSVPRVCASRRSLRRWLEVLSVFGLRLLDSFVKPAGTLLWKLQRVYLEVVVS